MASEYPWIERGWVKTVGQNQKIKKEPHMETAECNHRGLLTASQFICDAYSKMSQINSPQYMFSIPQEIGHGYFKQISTPQGIIVSEFRMRYKNDMEVMGRTDASTIDICFCLEEGIQWEWQDACKQLHINRG